VHEVCKLGTYSLSKWFSCSNLVGKDWNVLHMNELSLTIESEYLTASVRVATKTAAPWDLIQNIELGENITWGNWFCAKLSSTRKIGFSYKFSFHVLTDLGSIVVLWSWWGWGRKLDVAMVMLSVKGWHGWCARGEVNSSNILDHYTPIPLYYYTNRPPQCKIVSVVTQLEVYVTWIL
jgi:hypothetical protein